MFFKDSIISWSCHWLARLFGKNSAILQLTHWRFSSQITTIFVFNTVNVRHTEGKNNDSVMLTSACPDRGTYLAKWCLEGHIQSDLWCWCCKSGPTAPWFRSRSFSTQVQCAWLPVAWALWSAGCCTAHTQHDTGPFTTSPPDTSTAILCSGLLCIVLSAACRVKKSAVPGEVSAHTGWNQNQPHQYTNQHPHQVLGLKVPPSPPPRIHTHKVQAISFTCKMMTTTSSAEESVLSCWDSIQGTTDWTTTWPPKWGWSFHPSVPVAYKTTQCNTSCRHVPDQTLFLQNHIAEHIQQTCPRSKSVPTEPDSVTHADMSQLLHVEDSLACGDPPCRTSSQALSRNWKGQLAFPSRPGAVIKDDKKKTEISKIIYAPRRRQDRGKRPAEDNSSHCLDVHYMSSTIFYVCIVQCFKVQGNRHLRNFHYY